MNPCVWTLLLLGLTACSDMPRYRSYGPRDDAPQPAGDRYWTGVNQRLAPELLPQGVAADAINLRFRNGRPVKRGGASKVPWLNQLDPFARPGVVSAWGTVYGMGRFSDPDGLDWGILAADGEVYRVADSNSPEALELPSQTRVTYPVEFTQAATALIMWRGKNLAPLAMTDVDDGFGTINGGIANYSYGRTYADGNEVLFPGVPNEVFDDSLVYGDGDLVLFEGNHYLANTTTTAGDSPSTEPTKWDLCEWKPDTAYSPADIVVFSSTRFTVALATSEGETPLTNPEKFTLVESRLYEANTTTTAADLPTGTKFDFSRELIPAADTALFVQGRLVVPAARDTGLISDIFDYAFFQNEITGFDVSQTADPLVAFVKFNDTTVIGLKRDSVYIFANFYGTLSAVTTDVFTTEYGCVAAKSAVVTGKDLWFLSQRGVVSLTQTAQNQLQGVDLPVSDPVQPTIGRMNWGAASQAVAAYWDNKYYLALPLDGAQIWRDISSQATQVDTRQYELAVTPGNRYRCTVQAEDEISDGTQIFADGQEFQASEALLNITAFGVWPGDSTTHIYERVAIGNNAILVFDFLNQQWSGYDQGDAICPKFFFKILAAGRERLAFMGFDGYGNLYEEGATDSVYDSGEDSTLNTAEIQTTLLTRAYQTGDSLAHWQQAELQLETWNPSLTVTAIFPGIAEQQILWEDWTRSRTAYYRPFDKAAYDATNADDDHADPDRQDYSVVLGDGFELGTGVQMERKQAVTLRKRLRYHDSSLQLKLECAQGEAQLKSVMVEGTAGKRREGVIN